MPDLVDKFLFFQKNEKFILDSADLIAKLRSEHAAGNKTSGLDLYNGE